MRKLILLISFLLFSIVLVRPAYSWWNVSWQYRKPIIITERSGNMLTDYQVAINLTYDSNMQPDFSDIRFTYYNSTSDEETEIPYWIEEKVDSSWAYVWVKVPEIPANGQATIYMYYGNPNATSESNATAVWDVYENFDYALTADFDAVWTHLIGPNGADNNQGYSISNGILVDGLSGDDRFAKSYPSTNSITGYYFEFKVSADDDDLKANEVEFGTCNFGTGDYTRIYGTVFKVGNQYGSDYIGAIWWDGSATQVIHNENEGLNVFAKNVYYTVKAWGTRSKMKIQVYNGATLVIERTFSFSHVDAPINCVLFSGYKHNADLGERVRWDYIKVRKYTEPEPTYEIGGEEIPNQPPQITITNPTNTTYYTTNLELKFKVTDDNSTSLYVKTFLDDQLIYENANFANNSLVSLDLAQLLDTGSHSVKIWANDTDLENPRTSEMQVNFYIWYGLNVSVYNANGTSFPGALIDFYNLTCHLGYGFYSKANFFSKKICPDSGWQSTYEINLGKRVSGNITYQVYVYEHVYSDDCLSFAVDLQGYRDGNWETIKSIGYGYCGGYPTGHYVYSVELSKVYEKFRFRYRVTNYDSSCSDHGCGSCYYNVKIEFFNISYKTYWDLPLMLEWKDLPQGNVSVFAEWFGFDNETKEVKVNASMGLVNLNLTLYRLQRFRVKDKRTNAWLSNFTITFYKNSLPYLNKTVENELVVSLRNLKYGTNLIRVRKHGYNDTFETLEFNPSSEYDKIFYLWRSGLILNVFDEITGEKLRFNAQIFNQTYSLSFENVEKIDKQWNELPNGFVTIRIWNESYMEGSYEYRYPERYYYITMNPYTYLNMSGYLLRNDYGVNVFVVTKDPSMQSEPSVLVSAMKFIDNSWKTVAQILTDNQGQGYLYLHFNYPHKIKAEKENLKKLIEYYLPTSALPLEIKLESDLSQVSNVSTLKYVFDYLTVGFKPKDYYLKENQTYLFEFLVSSSKGNLEEYGMNITYNGTILYSKRINDNPSGGIIDVYVNTQNKTGKIEVIAWFKTSELEEPYVIKRNYFIASYPNFGFSVKEMVNQVNQSGLSDTSKKLIALFVSFFVALGVGRINVLGGGIAFVLALAFFAYFGWFDWLTLGLIGIVSFAIIYLKQYIV